MVLLGIAALITALTGVAAFLWTAYTGRKKNTAEHELNRQTIEAAFNVLRETVSENHRETKAGLSALAGNQEILFGMVADLDVRLAVLADKGKKTTVVRTKELVGVK